MATLSETIEIRKTKKAPSLSIMMEMPICGANWKTTARKVLSGMKICRAKIIKRIFASIMSTSEVLRIDLLFFLINPRPTTSEMAKRATPEINSITAI
jgi:hypothetical protein